MVKGEKKIYLKGFRSWAEISRKRLRENVSLIYDFTGKDVFAVVKADAYGHGAVNVSKILTEIPEVKYLCVATAEEGKELRKAGIDRDILVLGGVLEDEIECFKRYNLVPVISDFQQLNTALKHSIKKVHLKFDTGMHRLGFLTQDVNTVLEKIKKLQVEGLMSHFPSADTDPEFTKKQILVFYSIVNTFQRAGFYPKYIHLQNSAGLVYNCDYCNAVRVGISIYGGKPADNFPVPVNTVMSVKAKVITVKRLKKGDTVSYGGTFKAPKDMDVAVVAFGYADGLPRELSNRGYFLFRDRKLKILGSVTMDMTIVDATGIEIKPMDAVTVIGKDNKNEIYFEDIAKMCSTIPYEIMCRISKRVKRVVVDE
ncbi:alanine racemase [Persephonella atlantica]|uniref:Alanine racemase n=1 Tax=Persephonella atlantica TaxID=2699429 RepID=A0ABS1GGA1_9AQUI|nr:alanine racemase [Persephonella atlantica]MBK3331945.1 alanine racemase [Persephonella atlantica]